MELVDQSSDFHGQQVKVWERNMFLSFLQRDGNVNVSSTIQKLINDNGFDFNSEIGPFPKKERGKKGPKYHTALTWASWQGNLNLVKFIISEGANPQKLTSQGLAAIHCCSMKDRSDNLAVAKYLLEHPRFKIDINFCNGSDGITPLMYACSSGSYNIAEYLLQQNAEVNQQDSEGKSAFFYAVRGGHLNLARLLVAHDACVCLRDNNHATVLHHLIIVSSSISVTAFWDVLTYLVDEKGLCVSTPACDGGTALHEACRSGLTEVVGYLIRKGANLESKIYGWETPLWSLVMGKFPRPELVGLLQEKGANFEARHCLGMTLVQYAKQVSKNLRIVAALEDAQRVLKTNRMKTLLAKRRAILSFAPTTNGDCVAKNPFCTAPVLKETNQNFVQTTVSNDHHVNNSVETLDIKQDDCSRETNDTLLCEKNIAQEDSNVDNNDDMCSSISSGSLQSESFDEDDASDYSGSSSDNKDCSGGSDTEEVTEKPEVGKMGEEDHEDLTDDDDDDDDNMGKVATTNPTTVETTLLESVSCSSEEEDKDPNGNHLPCLSDKDNNVDDNKVDAEKEGDKNQKDDSSPSPSSSSKKRSNFDVDECFERLLRKKRLLEQQLELSSDDGEEDKKNVAVPQKINCVRRNTITIVLSDSD